MQPRGHLSRIIKITLPFLAAIFLSITPYANAVVNGLRVARMASEYQQPQRMAANLRQVVAREPWRCELWEQIGKAELQTANWDKAESAFLQAKQATCLSAEGLYQLGEVYAFQNDSQAAEQTWFLLLRKDESFAPELKSRAYERIVELRRIQGDFQGAAVILEEWRAFEPANPKVSFLLGVYLSVMDPDRALPFLLQASSADSTYTVVVRKIRRGIGQAREGEDLGYSWLMIGRALGSAGYWDLAREAFQHSVQASPEYAEAWAFLAEANFQTGRDGQPQFDRALTFDPNSVVVKALLGIHFRQLKNYDLALEYLQAVALEEPDEPMWQVELANTWAFKGDLVAALASFQKAVEIAPKDSQYWRYLALFSVEYNVDVRYVGLPAARQAVILAPLDPDALDVMGWTMVNLADYASAERYLLQSIGKDAHNPRILLHLGQLYIQKQEYQKGYPYLQQAALLSGDDSIGLVARRLLLRVYHEGAGK